MSPPDPRGLLARGNVAAMSLEGQAPAARYLAPEPMQVVCAAAAIRREPSARAEQMDQLIFGERFDALEREQGWAFGQAARDGYVGWVGLEALEPVGAPPTAWVSALRTYVFSEASIKSAPVLALSINALATTEGRDGRFVKLSGSGYVAERHLSPLGVWAADLAGVAQAFIGAPYLWGGRESVGLDCSGLVQQALYACGRAAPRDSDRQASLGQDTDPVRGLVRGDLVFWRGHVGIMLDPATLIHANAFHMAVAAEPLEQAITRIGETGGGQPTAYRRLGEGGAAS